MSINNITVLIPAYKPSDEMINVLNELSTDGYENIIVVDDGGGEEFSDIFDTAKKIPNVKVINHYINMGKGRALKTGINYYLSHAGEDSLGIVTADADGQHLPNDIKRAALEMANQEDTMILGSRKLGKDVPFKSKAGNTITRAVFRIVSGNKIYDTQTGLRAIPKKFLPDILRLAGEKYEYEMSMLMELNNMNLKVKELDIETVYLNNNEGSHFNPIIDSWKIYKIILGYVLSSAFSAIVDIVLFSYFYYSVFEGRLLLAIVFARIISSLVNFAINRRVLLPEHKEDVNLKKHLLMYYSLAVIVLGLSYAFTYVFVNVIGLNAVISKIICDTALFMLSFIVQKRVVFK